MKIELSFVFENKQSNEFSHWLPRLRQWILDNNGYWEKLGVDVAESGPMTIDAAMAWRDAAPARRLIVGCGFPSLQIQANASGRTLSSAPFIVGARGAALVDSETTYFISADIFANLRKAVMHMAAREQFDIRPVKTKDEMIAYLSFRYDVWKSSGYLHSENEAARLHWEVDIWDRMSLPIVALSNGTVVGSVRLIRTFGNEEYSYVSMINELIAENEDNVIRRRFNFQRRMEQPLDLLDAFPDFFPRFKDVVVKKKYAVEIGRVAVSPAFRGRSLAEMLVDAAISHAKKRRVDWAFLACPEYLVGLYARCGFKDEAGLRSPQFFHIKNRAALMERELRYDSTRIVSTAMAGGVRR